MKEESLEFGCGNPDVKFPFSEAEKMGRLDLFFLRRFRWLRKGYSGDKFGRDYLVELVGDLGDALDNGLIKDRQLSARMGEFKKYCISRISGEEGMDSANRLLDDVILYLEDTPPVKPKVG